MKFCQILWGCLFLEAVDSRNVLLALHIVMTSGPDNPSRPCYAQPICRRRPDRVTIHLKPQGSLPQTGMNPVGTKYRLSGFASQRSTPLFVPSLPLYRHIDIDTRKKNETSQVK
jgi:hypothetical protein